MGGDEMTMGFFGGPPFKLVKTHKGHSSFINSVRFNPEGTLLATVSADRKILLYNGKEGDYLE
jgi:WD repeat-containing protein 1 (actin-interacting protein 1)